MADNILKEILSEIKGLNMRLDKLEWLIIDSKLEVAKPTPEEIKIIDEYEKNKKEGTLSFKNFV